MDQFPQQQARYRLQDYNPERLITNIKQLVDYIISTGENPQLLMLLPIASILKFIVKSSGLQIGSIIDLPASFSIDSLNKGISAILRAERAIDGADLEIFEIIKDEIVRLACDRQILVFIKTYDKPKELIPVNHPDNTLDRVNLMLVMYEILATGDFDSIFISYNKVS